MERFNDKLTLSSTASYTIEVLGYLEEHCSEWDHVVEIRTNDVDGDFPVTTLFCIVDQAGLLGIIRRLYNHGIPLIAISLLET